MRTPFLRGHAGGDQCGACEAAKKRVDAGAEGVALRIAESSVSEFGVRHYSTLDRCQTKFRRGWLTDARLCGTKLVEKGV